MEQPRDWLFDLSKAPAEPGGPVLPDAARAQKGKSGQRDVRRSPAQVLGKLALFDGLAYSQLQTILKTCTIGAYDSGDEVCAMDTPGDELYVLISGELAFASKEQGEGRPLVPITTVGELCFMTKGQRPVGLRATKDSKVLRLNRTRFDGLPQDLQIRVYRNIVEILSKRLTICAETKCNKLARIWG